MEDNRRLIIRKADERPLEPCALMLALCYLDRLSPLLRTCNRHTNRLFSIGCYWVAAKLMDDDILMDPKVRGEACYFCHDEKGLIQAEALVMCALNYRLSPSSFATPPTAVCTTVDYDTSRLRVHGCRKATDESAEHTYGRDGREEQKVEWYPSLSWQPLQWRRWRQEWRQEWQV